MDMALSVTLRQTMARVKPLEMPAFFLFNLLHVKAWI